jgi:hypothetical protein
MARDDAYEYILRVLADRLELLEDRPADEYDEEAQEIE